MKIINFPLIENDDGSLVKILYEKSEVTANIREIYLNNVFFKKTKGWIFHKKANIYLCVVKGEVDISLIKKEELPKGYKAVEQIKLNDNKKNALFIKNNTWFKFTGISKNVSTVLVLSDLSHDQNERLKCHHNSLPFFDS
tara:strand:- start:577 stop:996 length:420 start_codon:yes stop_codon:yes gene_type:complete